MRHYQRFPLIGSGLVLTALLLVSGCGGPVAERKSRPAVKAAPLAPVAAPRALVHHPADADGNWEVSLQEAVAYATAYKRQTAWPTAPTPPTLAYAVKACTVFVRGLDYFYDTSLDPPFGVGPGGSIDVGVSR